MIWKKQPVEHQISELNSNIASNTLSNWVSPYNNSVIDQNYSFASKAGNVCSFTLSVKCVDVVGAPVRLATLSENARPKTNIFPVFWDETADKPVFGYISTAGSVSVYGAVSNHTYDITYTFVST